MTLHSSDSSLTESTNFEVGLSMIANNSDQNYLLLDKEYKLLALNKKVKAQYLKYFNLNISVGMSIFDISPDDQKANLKSILERVLNGSEESNISSIQLPNAPKKYVESKFKPAYDESGKLIGILIRSTDITSVKMTEKEKSLLEKSSDFEKENIKALINNSQSLIWSFDKEFKLISFNIPFEKYAINQFNVQPKIGDSFLDYEKNSDRINRFKIYAKRVLNGESYSLIEHSYEPNESWTEISFNPIWEKDKVVGIACTSIDVTERKLFEKSLIRSQNRLKQAQEIAHLGNWDLDFKTNSARWSDEAYRIYGITSHNFDHTFESWLSFIHPEDYQDVKAIIDEGAKTLKDYSMYHRIIRPDGSIRYLYSETHFEFDNNGIPIGVHGISQDITDRRTNEIKLQELLKKSNDQNRWLNNFTHIVSHNIRSHNTNISGIVNLIEDSRDKAEFNHLIKMLKDSTEKLGETIQNLSEYIMIQTNSDKQYKSINIREEVDKTCSAINQLISETGAEVKNEVEPGLRVNLIPAFIESILLNLITNAIKYRSPERKPVIKISNTKINSFQCLEVEDNGMGIDLSRHKDAIFGMFQTFHGNSDAVGFGLFITKNQIEAMDGKIEIESALDKGTKFKIYLHEKS